jgi:hypothetical protein
MTIKSHLKYTITVVTTLIINCCAPTAFVRSPGEKIHDFEASLEPAFRNAMITNSEYWEEELREARIEDLVTRAMGGIATAEAATLTAAAMLENSNLRTYTTSELCSQGWERRKLSEIGKGFDFRVSGGQAQAFEVVDNKPTHSLNSVKEESIRNAVQVPGKPGFVFSPFNNKVVDVRNIASGTLVADPQYPASEKKHFRVP